MLPLNTWTYDLLSNLLTDSVVGLFLKNFDLVKILLLGLGRMGRKILKIFACLPLDVLLEVFLFEMDLLNCADTHCLKDLLSLFTINLFQLDLFIAKRKSYATKPNSEIWGMFSAVLSFSLYCLMKATILSSEHVMFLASPSKYSFILKRETEQKLPSHSCGSAGWLMA